MTKRRRREGGSSVIRVKSEPMPPPVKRDAPPTPHLSKEQVISDVCKQFRAIKFSYT